MKIFLEYSMMAMVLGYFLDLIFGDPDFRFHPIRIIGKMIAFLDERLNRVKKIQGENTAKKDKLNQNIFDRKNYFRGVILVMTVLIVTVGSVVVIQTVTYLANPWLFVAAESVLVYFSLAQTSLKRESMKVYKALTEGSLKDARYAVSMIVGRDTEVLDEEGVVKAAVETVAENTSDGIVAPLMFTALFGSVGAYSYKVINTCDSMIGYKNSRYVDFGKAAARIDDVFNFIPSRFSAVLMIAASGMLGYDCKNAAECFLRDRYNHASPNSAQTESVCAGALGLKLAGDAWYGGKLIKKKPIGIEKRKAEPEDIKKSCMLMNVTCGLSLSFLVIVKYIFMW